MDILTSTVCWFPRFSYLGLDSLPGHMPPTSLHHHQNLIPAWKFEVDKMLLLHSKPHVLLISTLGIIPILPECYEQLNITFLF